LSTRLIQNSQILNRFGHFTEGNRYELCNLQSFHIVYVRREANSVANCLSRAAVTHVLSLNIDILVSLFINKIQKML
jgi:hypothetical protein